MVSMGCRHGAPVKNTLRIKYKDNNKVEKQQF
jgi:hypothetical protein